VTTFRRGFKSWCETTALQFRTALGLKAPDPLPAERLAAHIGLRVVDIGLIPGLRADALQQLTVADPSSWSAVMLTLGDSKVVVLNPSHSDGRQSNDLMHECAHVVLNHAPSKALRAATGALMLSAYDKQQEAEADWLAAALLLPRAALLRIVQSGVSSEEAAYQYRTSQALLRMRLNQTGVNLQMRRRVA